MGDPIMDWISANYLLIYFFLMNIFFIFILVRLKIVLGPFLNQTLRVAFGRMRDPNLFIHFLNSKTAILEWREYKQVVKLDPEESTSELIFADREKGFTAMTPNKIASKGFFQLPSFGLFGKKASKDELNTVYTDDFIPVNYGAAKHYYLFGRQMHVIYEGQTSTQNPLEALVPDAQAKKAAIAVELQLKANKLLAIDEVQNELATKSDVRMWAIINLAVAGLGLLIVGALVFSMQGAVGEFINFATSTFNEYKPAIEAFFKNIPRVVPE